MNTINFNKMKPIKKVGSGIKKSNIKFIIWVELKYFIIL
jgi:hypothetical protein